MNQQQPASGQHERMEHSQYEQQQHGQPQGRAMQPSSGEMGAPPTETGGTQQRPQTRMGGEMQQPRSQMGGAQRTETKQGMQQQGMQQQGMGGQQPIPRFEDHLTNELRIALDDFNDLTHIAEWCAKECTRAGPQLATCARICEDIADLAELNEKWIARDSMFGPDLAEQFVRIATEALPELEQHQQAHPHVTETIEAITRAIDSCRTVLQSVEGHGQGQGTTSQGTTSQGMQRPGPSEGMGGSQQPMGGQQF